MVLYTVELYTVIYYHDIPILVSGTLASLALAGQKDQIPSIQFDVSHNHNHQQPQKEQLARASFPPSHLSLLKF